MADKDTVVHIGENSPEQVAFKLVNLIRRTQSRRNVRCKGAFDDQAVE